MDNVINIALLSNPTNWVILFVIFTFWAFVAHLVEKSVKKTSNN